MGMKAIRLFGLICSSGVLLASLPAMAQTPPNIVLIMLDDLGKEGLGIYYRRTYNTPNIDSLAQQGTRFSQFYVDPVCSVTRASLMTGLYAPRTGAISNKHAETSCLDSTFGTFVQSLRDAGYATAVAGKWHLCPDADIFDHPNELGFDEWMLSPMSSYWGANVWINGVLEVRKRSVYMPDEHADFAISFIRRKALRPFFLYFPTNLPHTPWAKTPDTAHRGWPHKDPRYFPGMVRYADKLIGRIVAAIAAEGLARQTIIIVLADNGTSRGLPGGQKTETSENAINVPLVVKWDGVAPAGAIRHGLADVTDLYPTILEMAGAAPPVDRDGYSLVPLLREPAGKTGRQWIYAQNDDKFAIIKRNWKLRELGRLYDLQLDPFEDNPILPLNDTSLSATRRQELQTILLEHGLDLTH